MDPDKTAPIGALCSGSTLFTSIPNSSVMLGRSAADDLSRRHFQMHFFSWRFTASLHNKLPRPGNPNNIYINNHGYLRPVRMTSSCLKMTRLPLNDHSAFNCIKCVTILLSIASVISHRVGGNRKR